MIEEPSGLRTPKLSLQVAGRLRNEIVSGRLKEGDHLPSETELVELFNVSRPIIRESLRVLEAEQLIFLGRGGRNGAEVLRPSVARAAEYAASVLIAENATFGNLHEARRYLEPPIAGVIAARQDMKTVAQLREVVDDEEQALEAANYARVALGVNKFHETLIAGSNNPTLVLLVHILKRITDGTYSKVLIRDGERNPEAFAKNMTLTLKSQRKLIGLIEEGKGEEAEAFWARYMSQAQQFNDRTNLSTMPVEFLG